MTICEFQKVSQLIILYYNIILDMKTFADLPYFPLSLRLMWADTQLPKWVEKEIESVEYEKFDTRYVFSSSSKNGISSPRIKNFVIEFVNSHKSAIRNTKILSNPEIRIFNLRNLPFSTRTLNCLRYSGLLDNPDTLSRATYGILFKIPNMGTKSVLEVALLLEAESKRYESDPVVADYQDTILKTMDEPWVDHVGGNDPRFASIAPKFDGSILEHIDALTLNTEIDDLELILLASQIPSIHSQVEYISKLCLEESLKHFLKLISGMEGIRLTAFLDRFGWSGSLPITLEKTGNQLSITRERVRQIEKQIMGKIAEIPFQPYFPALDAAIQQFRINAPLSFSKAEALLIKHGISKIAFHPHNVIEITKLFGKTPPVQFTSVKGKKLVTVLESSTARQNFLDIEVILKTAYRQARKFGTSNVQELVSELKTTHTLLSEEEVRNVLQEFSNIVFLDEDWFCDLSRAKSRQPLRNVARKMLSVVAPLKLGEFRSGISRAFRFRDSSNKFLQQIIVPPKHILKAYFQIHPEFEVDGDLVNSKSVLDYRKELGHVERVLADALRSSPDNILDRLNFWKRCELREMNENTFHTYLSYSPIITRVAYGLWALRGVRIDPAIVEVLASEYVTYIKQPRVVDFGWNSEGNLWLAVRISDRNFLISIPSAIREYVVGNSYRAIDAYDSEIGTIRVGSQGRVLGLNKFLYQRGADEDDYLLMEFNLPDEAVIVKLGDEDSLSEMSVEYE